MDRVHVDIDGSVASVRWAQPARANAIGRAVAQELEAALRGLRDRDDVDVCVLRSQEGHFCGGWDTGDIAGYRDASPDEVRDSLASGRRVLAQVSGLPQVTVAAVTGAALGFGMSLLGRCDVIVSAADARFGYPEVTRDVVPVLVAPEAIALLGSRTAAAWLVTGAIVGAHDARAAGLPLRIVDPAELDAEVATIADQAARDALGRRTKRYLRDLASVPQAEWERFALDAAVANLSAGAARSAS